MDADMRYSQGLAKGREGVQVGYIPWKNFSEKNIKEE
jgi:hypothetical protein